MTPSPDFLFIGPDKSGSSWLQKVLSDHPDVYVPPAKDLYYFAQEYSRGPEWYLGHFAQAPAGTVVGEICHDYLSDAAAPPRIHAMLPDVKLVVCLREPVERTWSAYLNLQRHRETDQTFTAALDSEPSLIENSSYSRNLARFLALFPRDQLLVLWFDDLERDPQIILDQLCNFLGVATMHLLPEQRQSTRPAGQARVAPVARLAKRGAVLARRLGRPTIVGRVKSSSWVQGLLYRSLDDDVRRPPPEAYATVRARLGPDLVRLPEVLQVPMPDRWRETWD